MSAAMLVACVLCALLALARGRGDGKLVETAQGPVKGYLSERGDYFQFFGIPYATAPRGDHKFKAPLEPAPWSNVLEATNNNIVCPQGSMGPGSLFEGIQDEDCLVVNVFVPNTDKKNLTVIVHVHGGGFFAGSGNMLRHDALLHNDVIVVNFNYRLGTYGFLCLGTKDIPGNAGLKDQVAALRWVKRNIERFNGNPDDITIDGGSAGSASVEHLMLSPMARGLFTKVIAESGSALSPWAFSPDPIATAKRYMRDISNKSSDVIIEIEAYYKSLSTEQLTNKIYMAEPDSMLGFGPCVEARIEGEESFFNDSPLNILKSGNYSKLLFMPGFASEEGLFRIELFDQWAEKMEQNFAEFLPQDLTFKNDNEKRIVAAKVKQFYFKDEPVSVETIKEYVDYFTDVGFAYSIVRSARLHALNSVPVYLYDYSYVPSIQIPHAHSDKINGANHCAQILAVNKFEFMTNWNFSQDDILTNDRLVKMWTDFAKFGTPVTVTSELLPVPWEPVDPDRMNYLHMNQKFEAREHLLGERVEFWDGIYHQYYREPVAPDTPTIHDML